MPAVTAEKRTTTARTRRRTAPPPPATFRQPAIPEVAEKPEKRMVNGLEVIEEHLIRLQPKANPIKISKLELEDGSFVHACRECDFTGSRGDCMAHRNRVHGARFGMRRKKEDVLDLLVPTKQESDVAPETPGEMTLAQIQAIMPSIKALGDLVDELERERDELAQRCAEYEKFERTNATKLLEYDELQAAVVELRIRDRQRGNYEEIKAELYELRAWKKKHMKQRAAAVAALKVDEEEQ